MNNSTETRHWGFWATIAFGLLIFIIFTFLQTLTLLGYMYVNEGSALIDVLSSDSTAGLESLQKSYAFNGDAISIAEIPAALLGIALVMLFASMRYPLTVKNYLELYKPKIKYLLLFLGLMVIAMILMETVNSWLDRSTPEFMTKVYASTKNLPMLWIAVGVAAPFFEEFLFRGFILEGLRHSRIGIIGAIIITSASWAIIHMQYGWFEIITIFFIGVLLAIAKLKTKSLYVPIAMHMLMNLAASIGMALSYNS
jgi:membrane protease YdiL (CAAX protease family)